MSDLDKSIEALGKNINKIITDALTVEDVRSKRTSAIEFHPSGETGIYGKGLLWKGDGTTKQLIYRNSPDRFFLSESLDLGIEKTYSIGNIPVLSASELGGTVTRSKLTEVGTLKELKTTGNLTVDGFVFYNSDSGRLSVGIEEPNGMFSVATIDAEFIIDPEGDTTRIGNFTTDDLALITDDTDRLTITKTGHVVVGQKGNDNARVSIHGSLGVGIHNVSQDVSIETSGPIRIQGTKHQNGTKPPRKGRYNKGDIVWNSEPKPTGYVGWICVREGTPGEWKPFGQISS